MIQNSAYRSRVTAPGPDSLKVLLVAGGVAVATTAPPPTFKEVASMRRTKLVLAAATLMVAMLVAFAAPAMANTNDRNVQHHTSNVFDHNGDNCCKLFDNNGDDVVFVAVPVWGWGWEGDWEGDWEGGCDYDWDGPVTPVDCWD